MRKHFTDPAQASRSETKMRELQYKGDTSQYLAELLELNTDVNWTGPSFQKLIARALPKKVIELVYSKRGVLPTLDQEYLQAVGEAGRTYELMQEDDALRTTRQSGKGEPDSTSGRSKSGQPKSKDNPPRQLKPILKRNDEDRVRREGPQMGRLRRRSDRH